MVRTLYKKIPTLHIIFLLLGLGNLNAQKTVLASGGEASGNGGTTSYSIGQVAYVAYTGTSGSVVQGVQQVYEISITTGIDGPAIDLKISANPNPVTNFLTLTISNDLEPSTLDYLLYDVQGKLIRRSRLTGKITTITMENLQTALYFLKVTDSNNKEIKGFKIIKR